MAAAESPTLSAVPDLAGRDQRGASRFGAGMPYVVDGCEGQTLDLSATGLSFDSNTAYPVGSLVEITLRYGLDGHNFPITCKAEVMRVEPQGARFVIGARWCEPFFNPDA